MVGYGVAWHGASMCNMWLSDIQLEAHGGLICKRLVNGRMVRIRVATHGSPREAGSMRHGRAWAPKGHKGF